MISATRLAQATDPSDAPVREGTPAVRIKDHVPEELKGERLERLIAVVRRVARTKSMALVGTTQEVLVEGPSPRVPGRMTGRTGHHRIVHLRRAPPR